MSIPGETSENTAKNVSNPHIYESCSQATTSKRPGSAPFEVDPRQKTKTSEFSSFRPKQPPPPPVEKCIPEPIAERTATHFVKTVHPFKDSKLIASKVKSTIPPIIDVKTVATNQSKVRKPANQEPEGIFF